MQLKVAIIDHIGIKAGMDCYDIALYRALHNLQCKTLIYSNFSSNEPGIFKRFRFKVSEDVFSFIRMLSVYRSISRDLASRNVGHCILHGFRFGFAEWMLIRALKSPRLKIYLIVHDPESLLGSVSPEKWRRRIFALCSRIVVHNRFSAREIFRKFKDAELLVSIIPHGHFLDTAVKASDVAGFKSKNLLNNEKKYLLFFGHIKKSKGLDIMLKALAQTSEDICLIIAGRMRKHGFDEYKEIIENYGLQRKVKIFPGYISPEIRNELFQAADAVVLPYRKVFQSGILLMAMSYGKAVIASDLSPNKEVITDKTNGFLFRSEDVKSLAETIEVVMNDKGLRDQVAESGKIYVESHHDWNKIASEWLKIFQG
jgi:glycosyltransferase involved in cell wall biosynthesis